MSQTNVVYKRKYGDGEWGNDKPCSFDLIPVLKLLCSPRVDLHWDCNAATVDTSAKRVSK